jgi:hypothetical protein
VQITHNKYWVSPLFWVCFGTRDALVKATNNTPIAATTQTVFEEITAIVLPRRLRSETEDNSVLTASFDTWLGLAELRVIPWNVPCQFVVGVLLV